MQKCRSKSVPPLLATQGGAVVVIAGDTVDQRQLVDMVTRATARLGQFDLLVVENRELYSRIDSWAGRQQVRLGFVGWSELKNAHVTHGIIINDGRSLASNAIRALPRKTAHLLCVDIETEPRIGTSRWLHERIKRGRR